MASFDEFGVDGVVPVYIYRYLMSNLKIHYYWSDLVVCSVASPTTYIIPEIMRSYSSHIGTRGRSRARAMISGRFAVAAMMLVGGLSDVC